jgi:hypothetical protein
VPCVDAGGWDTGTIVLDGGVEPWPGDAALPPTMDAGILPR